MTTVPKVFGGSDAGRIASLEEIRAVATEGGYAAALDLIQKHLEKNPLDLDGLRIKGNVLELKALDENEYSSKRLTSSKHYMLARECYEEILRIDPRNTIALMDLGDHFKNLGAFDKSMSYYEQLATLLRDGESRLSPTDEVRDLLDRASELIKQRGMAGRAERLRESCEKILKLRELPPLD